ncbi:MAG: Rod shape-determining protein MreD [Bacteroidota bacterium]
MILFDTAFAFFYVGFILFLPVEVNTASLLLIGFFSGLIMDVFYDSIGIHMAACVAVAFVRNKWIELLTPRGGYDQNMPLSIQALGFQWMASYGLPLILVHHITLFAIEASSLSLLGLTLKKALFSSFFSLLLIILYQLLFYKSSTRR